MQCTRLSWRCIHSPGANFWCLKAHAGLIRRSGLLSAARFHQPSTNVSYCIKFFVLCLICHSDATYQ